MIDEENAGATAGKHEAHVHGSIVEQTHNFLQEHMKADVITVTEPVTGIQALALRTSGGVLTAVPETVFDATRTQPKRRQGSATMLDLKSYIDHFNRFADDDSVTFANNDRATPSLTGVLDYHKIGAASDPRFGKHRTLFRFPLSDEWKVWNEFNRKPMTQEEFAYFLEDHFINVIPADIAYEALSSDAVKFVDGLPGSGSAVSKIADPGKLMQIATDLKVLESSIVGEARNLATGEASIEFKNELQDAAGQKLTLPQLFILGIPVFINDTPYAVVARLRFRKTSGGLRFWYELWAPERVFDDAFNGALTQVADKTGKPVLIGQPEAA